MGSESVNCNLLNRKMFNLATGSNIWVREISHPSHYTEESSSKMDYFL